MGDLAGADGTAAAGIAVLDHDLLAERGAHLVGDRACQDVIGAARRQRNDKYDRPVRIVVGKTGRNKTWGNKTWAKTAATKPATAANAAKSVISLGKAPSTSKSSSTFLLQHRPLPADILSLTQPIRWRGVLSCSAINPAPEGD